MVMLWNRFGNVFHILKGIVVVFFGLSWPIGRERLETGHSCLVYITCLTFNYRPCKLVQAK